jgi:hypothetical protein
MTTSYRDLSVWQKPVQLTVLIYGVTRVFHAKRFMD